MNGLPVFKIVKSIDEGDVRLVVLRHRHDSSYWFQLRRWNVAPEAPLYQFLPKDYPSLLTLIDFAKRFDRDNKQHPIERNDVKLEVREHGDENYVQFAWTEAMNSGSFAHRFPMGCLAKLQSLLQSLMKTLPAGDSGDAAASCE